MHYLVVRKYKTSLCTAFVAPWGSSHAWRCQRLLVHDATAPEGVSCTRRSPMLSVGTLGNCMRFKAALNILKNIEQDVHFLHKIPDKTEVDSKTASLSIGCSSEHARYSRSKEWCSQSRKQAQHVFAPARPCQVIVTFSATYLFESFSFHIPFGMVYDSLILKQFAENKSWESST